MMDLSQRQSFTLEVTSICMSFSKTGLLVKKS